MTTALLITNIILVCICLIVAIRLCDLEQAIKAISTENAQIKTIVTENLLRLDKLGRPIDAPLPPWIREEHLSAEQTKGKTAEIGCIGEDESGC